MVLHSIETGNFMLDGGAMFGTIPKQLWGKVYPANENNLCNLCMRCLLIETGQKLILIDTGIGNKQSERFFSHYFLNGSNSLEKSLGAKGFSLADITDVILTHLHFDHCGGAVSITGEGHYHVTFPNATYWISGPQWRWAMEPNQREKASYLLENFEPIERCGKLHFIDSPLSFTNDIRLRFFNGHTEGLVVPFITYNNKTLVFATDLFPTAAHVPASWICGYDTRPLISMEERKDLLKEAYLNNYVLFFEHDIYHECCTLKETEKGMLIDRGFSLEEFKKL